MTSFAFIFGVLPLLFATGAGAEMRHALGTVVFYGMIGVTFFGLFLTPVFYTVIRKLRGDKPNARPAGIPQRALRRAGARRARHMTRAKRHMGYSKSDAIYDSL